MADDKKPDNDPVTPADDGWGEVADKASEAHEPSPQEEHLEEEWGDPAHLEERVAALVSDGDLPVSLPVHKQKTEESPAEEQEEEPEELQDLAGTIEVADEDAPQWNHDDEQIPAPSSDMLAAAEVLAEKEDPKAEKRRKRRERGPKTQLTRRQLGVIIGGGSLALLVAICALLGWFNAKHYYLVCQTKSISAQQGRFWPWGQSQLDGDAFRNIRIPSDVLCANKEFDSRNQLEIAFLAALLEQSTALLAEGDTDLVDEAERQLEQALLLSRTQDRETQRAEAKRLQGDVLYLRAAAEIQQAQQVLQSASNHFDAAAAMRPRHSNDANAWAEHGRFISSEIDKGPKVLRKDELPKAKPHFQGLSESPVPRPAEESGASVPIEPVEDSADAGVPPSVAPDAQPFSPDAGLPKGGVLL